MRDHPHTSRRWLLLALCAWALCALPGCDGEVSEAAPSSVREGYVGGAGGDLGGERPPPPPPDPLAARFVPVAPDGDALASRWGFMVAERRDGTALIFGGTDYVIDDDDQRRSREDSEIFGDVWHVDARVKPPVFTHIPTEGGPDPRYMGCAAWDPNSETALVVGGRGQSWGEEYAETWRLDAAAGTWQRILARHQPRAVKGCALAWSEHRDAFILFGGAQGLDVSDETWLFDPEDDTWLELDPPKAPVARRDAVMVPVSDHEMLMMGGEAYGHWTPRGVEVIWPDDVWIFDVRDQRWTPKAIEGPRPPGRRAPWLVPDRGGIYMGFGVSGIYAEVAHGDLWWLDLEARQWAEVDLGDQAPSPRGFTPCLPGGRSALGMMFGGLSLDGETDDQLWLLKKPR